MLLQATRGLSYELVDRFFNIKVVCFCPFQIIWSPGSSFYPISCECLPLSSALLTAPGWLQRAKQRIRSRVKSNGEFKCSCLPSYSMIYLEHPSFGIQLQHLTEGGKV